MRVVMVLCIVGVIGGSLGGAGAPAAAQPEANWSLIVYDTGLNALVELTAAGSTVLPLPEVAYLQPGIERDFMHFEYLDVNLTPDRRYLVAVDNPKDPDQPPALIVDLTDQSVISVDYPTFSDGEYLEQYNFGAFNPALTEAVLTYRSRILSDPGGRRVSGGIVTVDLATGRITAQYRYDPLLSQLPDSASIPRVEGWTPAGIKVVVRCHECYGPTTATYWYQVLNPATGELMGAREYYRPFQCWQLLPTGELLSAENHPEYPLGIEGWRGDDNVIAVYAPGEHPPDAAAQVIYFSDAGDYFMPFWIMAGQAALISIDDHNLVIARDGRQMTVDYPDNETFRTMTDDGWLTANQRQWQIIQYRVSDTEITRELIYQGQGWLETAYIDYPAVPERLPPFVREIAPPAVFFCPGSLASQFEPGDWAELTGYEDTQAIWDGEGEFNPRELWLSGSALPDHAIVQILGEPRCIGGFELIKVDYQGRTGWVIELGRTSYNLIPAEAPAP
jgi:hypothetical protein